MSLVISHIINNRMCMMGDKRVTHTIPDDKAKDGYIVTGKDDNEIKVYKINSNVLIGFVGSSFVHSNLLSNIYEKNSIKPECHTWDYNKFKCHLDPIFNKMYNYLNNDKSLSPYAKTFRLALGGKRDNNFYLTVYQYPSKYNNIPIENKFNKNDNTILVFSQEKYNNLYKETYYSNKLFQSGKFDSQSIAKAFEETIVKMAQIDESISTTFDFQEIIIDESIEKQEELLVKEKNKDLNKEEVTAIDSTLFLSNNEPFDVIYYPFEDLQEENK